MRLDKYIFEKFDLRSRTFAENIIIKGKVKVSGEVVTKPSFDVRDGDNIEVDISNEYESLGGDKLAHALAEFKISLTDKRCADIGAANGGFTDCMLRAGAKAVYAVDVAECALSERLISDSRVFVREFVNARHITTEATCGPVDFLCVDVSFISLKLVLDPCLSLLTDKGEAVILIKPQFELGHRAGKSGIVLNPRDRLKILNDILAFTAQLGYCVTGLTRVPDYFVNKNIEYLIHIQKSIKKSEIPQKLSLDYFHGCNF